MMFDLNTSIWDSEYGEGIDDERLADYIDALMNEFAESPEGQEFSVEFGTTMGYSAMYMEYAARYVGETPATISKFDTREVIFELVPRKVSVEPEAASEIVAEMRAFWRFLKRTRDVAQADEILELFDDEAASRLEAELANEDNFGMAKSVFAAGKAAGFDMTTQEGLDAFMLAYNSQLLLGQPETEAIDDWADEEDDRPFVTAPIQSESTKIGRNAPCPCGSGRKYKKCCGQT